MFIDFNRLWTMLHKIQMTIEVLCSGRHYSCLRGSKDQIKVVYRFLLFSKIFLTIEIIFNNFYFKGLTCSSANYASYGKKKGPPFGDGVLRKPTNNSAKAPSASGPLLGPPSQKVYHSWLIHTKRSINNLDYSVL